MKKTFTINISGIVFHIDEDAYDVLKSYLNKITGHFLNTEEGREIIADIEARIAELFRERLEDNKEVITIADVQQVIKIMGEPEEIINENGEENHSGSSYSRTNYKTGKRIYRDPDERILGGVGSGLAAYFGIDPLIIRVIFVILFFISVGTGFIAYLILWAVLPEAKTTAQKLEMKGERVNVENIERSIRDEYEGVKRNFKNMKASEKTRGLGKAIEQIFGFIVNILQAVLKAIGPVIGFALIIAGLALILAILASFIFRNGIFAIGNIHWSFVAPPGVFQWVADPTLAFMIFLGVVLVIAIPVIGIIYSGIKLIFRFHPRDKYIGASLGALWFIGLVLLIIASIGVGKDFQVKDEIITRDKIAADSSKIMIIQAPDVKIYDEDYLIVTDEFRIGNTHNKNMFYIRPELDVIQNKHNVVELEIISDARGMDFKHARKNAQSIAYNHEFGNDTLKLDPFFTIGKNKKWRNQDLEMKLKIPVGQIIYLDPSLEDIIYDIYNVDGMLDYEMLDKYWIMTEEGLDLYRDEQTAED